jgi:uncharacterized protein (UPF0335 family)
MSDITKTGEFLTDEKIKWAKDVIDNYNSLKSNEFDVNAAIVIKKKAIIEKRWVFSYNDIA